VLPDVAREELLAEAKREMARQERFRANLADAKIRVNAKHAGVKSNVEAIGKEVRALVEASEGTLLRRLESICTAKLKILDEQQADLNLGAEQLAQVSLMLRHDACVDDVSLFASLDTARATLKEIRARCGSYAAQEDDVFHFARPNMEHVRRLADLGHVSGTASAANSLARGRGIKRVILGNIARCFNRKTQYITFVYFHYCCSPDLK
jgi:hypothetical protein